MSHTQYLDMERIRCWAKQRIGLAFELPSDPVTCMFGPSTRYKPG